MNEDNETTYWEFGVDRELTLGGDRTHIGDFVIATKSKIPKTTGLVAYLLEGVGGQAFHLDPRRIDAVDDSLITEKLFFADGSIKVWRFELAD
jgi:hypothetical protein